MWADTFRGVTVLETGSQMERNPDPVNKNVRCETYSLDDIAFIQEESFECAKSELHLFSVPATRTSIESETYSSIILYPA
jgi:hypothetical protein